MQNLEIIKSVEKVLQLVKIGKDKAIKKKVIKAILRVNDRETQRVINNARLKVCIINDLDGKGYYIPTEKEIKNLESFIAKEKKTIKTRCIALNTAKKKLKELRANERIKALGL